MRAQGPWTLRAWAPKGQWVPKGPVSRGPMGSEGPMGPRVPMGPQGPHLISVFLTCTSTKNMFLISFRSKYITFIGFNVSLSFYRVYQLKKINKIEKRFCQMSSPGLIF